MRYTKEKWVIEPQNVPKLIKHCSKCGCDATFSNSYKFRVNANGKALDIWMIYNCETCKTSYNLTIFERINPQSLENCELEAFMSNASTQIERVSFDMGLYKKNKVTPCYEHIEYRLIKEKIQSTSDKREITLETNVDLPLRLDKFLCKELLLSRSHLKKQVESGFIGFDTEVKLNKSHIKNGFTFWLQEELFCEVG